MQSKLDKLKEVTEDAKTNAGMRAALDDLLTGVVDMIDCQG